MRNDPLVDANGSSRVSRVNVCDKALFTDGPAASRILRRVGSSAAWCLFPAREGGSHSKRFDPVRTRGVFQHGSENADSRHGRHRCDASDFSKYSFVSDLVHSKRRECLYFRSPSLVSFLSLFWLRTKEGTLQRGASDSRVTSPWHLWSPRCSWRKS